MKFRELLEGELKQVLNIHKDMDGSHAFKPAVNKNYDYTINYMNPYIKDFGRGSFLDDNKELQFTKIEIFDVDAKKSLKKMKSEIKKMEKQGFDLLWHATIGKKGQDWTGLIYKYGQMDTAVLVKEN